MLNRPKRPNSWIFPIPSQPPPNCSIFSGIGQIHLSRNMSIILALSPLDYLYHAFSESLKSRLPEIPVSPDLSLASKGKVFQYSDYEQLNLERVHDQDYLLCSYIYRKALIRKHYLAHTVHAYVVKNSGSILNRAFPETYQIEVDYAEFLDDALDECYELRDEISTGQLVWILKPSMSDKGQGIRIFRTLEELQEIFDLFDEEEPEGNEDEAGVTISNGVVTSQLRLFIVQKYISKPLLLPAHNNKKFHIRTYVLCSGALTVYVYKRMLALFAATSYSEPLGEIRLNDHLTNTCLQDSEYAELHNSVEEFSNLKGLTGDQKEKILTQIYSIVGELFKAALNVDKINFQPLPNAFEFYGLDFLVDDQLNVSVLEVNAYPDFKQTGEDLKSLVYGFIDLAVSTTVAPFFGKASEERDDLVKVLEEKTGFA